MGPARLRANLASRIITDLQSHALCAALWDGIKGLDVGLFPTAALSSLRPRQSAAWTKQLGPEVLQEWGAATRPFAIMILMGLQNSQKRALFNWDLRLEADPEAKGLVTPRV